MPTDPPGEPIRLTGEDLPTLRLTAVFLRQRARYLGLVGWVTCLVASRVVGAIADGVDHRGEARADQWTTTGAPLRHRRRGPDRDR